MTATADSGLATIPEVVIVRLPLYVRVLTQLRDAGTEVVSSRELGDRLGVTPAQIRKDLSYFGRFGKQGRGYNVSYLVGEL
ncbi:MAG: winged-helix domain-containing protein, partial [Dehalococcoidia bacterium]